MFDAEQKKEAVRYADDVVRMTQPSGFSQDSAPWLWDNKSPVKQLLLQFQQPMSVIFQNIAFDMPNAIKQKQALRAVSIVGWYVMSAVAVGLLENMGDDDDDTPLIQDIAGYAAGGLLESIPIFGGAIGRMAEAKIRGEKAGQVFYSNYFPVLSSGLDAVNAFSNGQWLRGVNRASDAFGYAAGLPVGLKKEGEKALNGKPLALLGAR
jgi:hypothetical protein